LRVFSLSRRVFLFFWAWESRCTSWWVCSTLSIQAGFLGGEAGRRRSGFSHLFFEDLWRIFSGRARKNPQPDKTRLSALLKIRLSASCRHCVAVARIAFLRGGYPLQFLVARHSSPVRFNVKQSMCLLKKENLYKLSLFLKVQGRSSE
jgi:hypothetical protein